MKTGIASQLLIAFQHLLPCGEIRLTTPFLDNERSSRIRYPGRIIHSIVAQPGGNESGIKRIPCTRRIHCRSLISGNIALRFRSINSASTPPLCDNQYLGAARLPGNKTNLIQMSKLMVIQNKNSRIL